MEVAALEKKGHGAFAKALKPFTSSEHKRSKRLVSAAFCNFFFFSCDSDVKDSENVIF
jgi:hypothetical protein